MKRVERHRDKCVCGDHEVDCGHCGVALMIAGVVMLLTIIGTVLTFSSAIHMCTKSSQCEAGPERGQCVGAFALWSLFPIFARQTRTVLQLTATRPSVGVDGVCFYVAQHGVPCDDNSACTVSDQCHHGVCRGIELTRPCALCDDGVFVPDPMKDGNACSDGSMCTVHDACRAGECTGSL